MATTLELLREHGPAGPAFWCFGRNHREPLLEAIGNARRDAYLARSRKAAREEQRRREEEEAARRESWRPVCKDCGQKFTDTRWKAVEYTRDWSKRQSHPHLCEHCQHQAVTAQAKQQAKTRAEERERQEQERLRQEAEEQAAAQKAGGWLSRFRT